VIRDATDSDVEAIAVLAETRRVDYEQAQPQFWRRAVDAVEVHRPWLAQMVRDPNVVSLVAVSGDRGLAGYAFGTVVPSPPVYAPGGPTGLIDDFQIADPGDWPVLGVELLAAARQRLAALGVAQIVVVCGQHDQPKRDALVLAGLSAASEWYVQPVGRASVPFSLDEI
jgi:hypothetical protein